MNTLGLQTASVPTYLLEFRSHAALCVNLDMEEMVYFSFNIIPKPEPTTTFGVNQGNLIECCEKTGHVGFMER